MKLSKEALTGGTLPIAGTGLPLERAATAGTQLCAGFGIGTGNGSGSPAGMGLGGGCGDGSGMYFGSGLDDCDGWGRGNAVGRGGPLSDGNMNWERVDGDGEYP
jgi:hypothetical protein